VLPYIGNDRLQTAKESQMTSVVVVGAGISGLAAAYRLQERGVEVTVLESEHRAGGRVATEQRGRYIVDTGPDAITASYESYLRLVSDLGLSGQVVDSSPVVGLVLHGRLIDIDTAKVVGLPFTPVLSARGKLRLVRGLLRLRRSIKNVDTYQLTRSAASDDPHTTAHDFGVRHFGPEVTDYLIDPMMRLTVGSGAREASSLNVLGALGAWSGPLRNIRGGLAAVTDALASRLTVHRGATVTAVHESGSSVSVSYVDDTGAHEIIADSCVIGAMYHRATEIWPPLSTASPAFGDKLRNVKLISVSLGYRVPTRSKAYPVLVPTVENPEALLIFLQHNKSPDRAPRGHSLITVLTDTTVTDRFLGRSDEQLESWAAGIVERLCPELSGHRDMGVVTRWPFAGYLADPGFWRRTAALRNSLPAGGCVHVAGDLFGAGSLESAVRGGELAAAHVLDTPGLRQALR
jgi:protoporphyrinogen/coproporphyrinogen III oxidase